MKGTPAQPNPSKSGLTIPIRMTFDPMPPEQSEPEIQPNRVEEMPRQMPIHNWMLKKYGYTNECKGCEQRKTGLGTRLPHSQLCRRRIEESMAEDQRGKGTKQRADDRLNEWLSKDIEIQSKEEPLAEEEAGEKEEEKAKEYVVDPEQAHRDGEGRGAERGPEVDSEQGLMGSATPIALGETPAQTAGSAPVGDRVEKRATQTSTEGVDKRRRIENENSQKKRPQSQDPERNAKKQVVVKQGQKRFQSNDERETHAKKIKDEYHEEETMEIEGLDAVRELSKIPCKILKVKAVDRVRDGVTGQTLSSRDSHEQQESAWDDLTGASLDPIEVRRARMVEIEYARRKKVWTKIRRAEARRRGLKIIKVRWIDVNKGDALDPNIRCRLVAKEFNNGVEDGLFAATPPLEALRLLVSSAATVKTGAENNVIMINDVSRAFFEAPINREVCIELPDEDLDDDDRDSDMVGASLLLRAALGHRGFRGKPGILKTET